MPPENVLLSSELKDVTLDVSSAEIPQPDSVTHCIHFVVLIKKHDVLDRFPNHLDPKSVILHTSTHAHTSKHTDQNPPIG